MRLALLAVCTFSLGSLLGCTEDAPAPEGTDAASAPDLAKSQGADGAAGADIAAAGDAQGGDDQALPTDDGGEQPDIAEQPDTSVPPGTEGGVSADLAMAGGPDLAGQPARDLAGQPARDLAGQPPADLRVPDLFAPPDLIVAPDGGGVCAVASRACYSGPMNTQGVGVCRAGVQFCKNGVFGPCTGEVTPTMESCNGVDDNCVNGIDEGLGTISCGVGACRVTVNACANGKPAACVPGAPGGGETCGNNIDDNCNGLVDEGCGCVYVSPAGNDNNAGTAGSPKRTIGAAIGAAGTNGLPKVVCVSAGANCTTVDYVEDVVMRDGVSVLGGYQASGNVWPRNAACVTRIIPSKPVGVYFDKSIVTAATTLDGFTINGHADPTSAAVTVEGSTGAVISNNLINGGAQTTSYGVNVIDSAGVKATPLIARNVIVGGTTAALAIGVRALNSAPTINANCATIDQGTGRCTSSCPVANNIPGLSIRSRAPNATGASGYGVRLENSPGTVVSQNGICGTTSTVDQAALRLSGDGAGIVINANNMIAFGAAMQSPGIWADPCKGGSPWVLNNTAVLGNTSLMGGRADGVRAIGDCHVRVDSNVLIVGGVESANNNANGVWCTNDPNSNTVSRCTVLNNTEIRGSGGGYPPSSVGVRCDNGACARIENNARISSQSGVLAYGVYLDNTGAFVNNNRIEAGCGTMEATGLYSVNSYARVQNNQIYGNTCANGVANAAPNSQAVKVLLGAGPNEIDLHSNDLFGQGTTNCTSRALVFNVVPGGAAPAGPLGVVRNNILISGACPTRFAVEEQTHAADPRVFENNDLWTVGGAPTALYRDEGGMNLVMIGLVNALPGAANNISADPLFVNGNHLPMNSPCTNAGTNAGAPATDYEGDARPQQAQCDVGMDEFKP